MPASRDARPEEPAPSPCVICGALVPPWWSEIRTEVLKTPGHWVKPPKCDECARKIHHYVEPQKTQIEKLVGGVKASEFTFESYKAVTPSQKEALAACQKFSTTLDNLYLWGKCGTGKTHLACAAAAAAQAEDKKVEFWKPAKFLRSLRLLDPHHHNEKLERYARADMFVLDDLGLGRDTDFSLEAFYELVDMRDMRRRNGLIITSNLSLEDLAKKMEDDRLTSRLMGICRFIKIEAPDARARIKR